MSTPTRPVTPARGARPALRRGRARLAAVLAVLVALLGAALAGAAPASAAETVYGVWNRTNQTLTFVSAHGPATFCTPREVNLGCTTDGNNAWRVTQKIVIPRSFFTVRSEANDFNKREANTFRVTYRIGESNDLVILEISPFRQDCTVHGTKDYTCVRTAAPGEWALTART